MGRRRLLRLATFAGMASAAACGSLVGSNPVAEVPSDGGSVIEGGSVGEAGPSDGGALIPACTHMFCADFEGPSLYRFDTAKPTTPFEDGGWFLSSTYAVSGSHSLGTLVHPDQSARLEKNLGTDLKRIEVELRLRFEHYAYVSGKANPLTIHCASGGDVALIKASDTKIQVSSTDDHDVSDRTNGVWHHLVLVFDITGKRIVLTDTSDTGSATNEVPASSDCTGATSLQVGDDPASGGGTYELYIDDVLADWQ